MGDLNYRVDMDKAAAEALVAEGNLMELLRHDQLTREKAAGRVFQGFHEQSIAFPPTYKYDKGTERFDTSLKQRVPSYTDRVLFRTTLPAFGFAAAAADCDGDVSIAIDGNPPDLGAGAQRQAGVQTIAYSSVPSVKVSDHRPVIAQFLVTVRTRV